MSQNECIGQSHNEELSSPKCRLCQSWDTLVHMESKSQIHTILLIFYWFLDWQTNGQNWELSGFFQTSRSLNRVRQIQPWNLTEQDQGILLSPTGERTAIWHSSGHLTSREHTGLWSKVINVWLMSHFLPILTQEHHQIQAKQDSLWTKQVNVKNTFKK